MPTIILPPGTPDDTMQPARFVGFSKSAPIKERPTEYSPLQVVPDSGPLQSVRRQILRSIDNALNDDSEYASRMDDLNVDIRAFDQLTKQCANAKDALADAQANAVADDIDLDEEPYRKEIARISRELKEKGKRGESAKGALKILQAKRDELKIKLSDLNSELARADEKWLRARHSQIAEEVRSSFHDLHQQISLLLAMEASVNFVGHEWAWYAVQQLRSGLSHENPLRPDWLNAHDRRSFPGFAASSAALKAEMSGEDE
jgi:hypothetical protein